MAHPVFEGALAGSGPILGTMVTYAVPDAVELQMQLAPHFIVLDCQHALLDEPTAHRLLYACNNRDKAVIVRVSSNDHAKIGRMLDAGADGVIVPMVNTAEEARHAVASCRYGPHGDRSYGPTRQVFPRVPAEMEARVSCFAMIETVQALENLDEICATPGLAGVYLGPADMAVSMGELPSKVQTLPALREAGRKIVSACRKAGVIAGAQAGPTARTKDLIDDGFQLLTTGIDWTYARSAIVADVDELQRHIAGAKGGR